MVSVLMPVWMTWLAAMSADADRVGTDVGQNGQSVT
jgi:hypothetical protein